MLTESSPQEAKLSTKQVLDTTRRLISFLILVAVQTLYTGGIGILIGLCAYPIISSQICSGFVIFIFFYLLATWMSVAIHEAGHALFFMMSGFETAMIRVGPLLAWRVGKRWRLRVDIKTIASGITVAIPRQPDIPLSQFKRSMAWGVIGGPLAGFAWSALNLGIYSLFPDLAMIVQAFLILTAGVSLLGTLASLIPARFGQMSNDAMLIRTIFSKDHQGQAVRIIYLLTRAAIKGQRPREWDTEAIQRLTAPGGVDDYRAHGHFLAYYAALDGGDVDTAAHELKQALELVIGKGIGPRPNILKQIAYLEARFGEGYQKAKAWLKIAGRNPVEEPHTNLVIQSAIYLSEGDPKGALEKIKRGLIAAQRSVEPGTARAEIDWLEEMQAEANAVLQSGSQPSPAPPTRKISLPDLQVAKTSRRNRLLALGGALVGLIPLAAIFLATIRTTMIMITPACAEPLLANAVCKFKALSAYSLGKQAFDDADYTQAIEQFSSAVSYDPHLSEAYLALGTSLMATGDYAKAIPIIGKSIEQNPTAEAYNYQGWSYLYLGNYWAAIDDAIMACTYYDLLNTLSDCLDLLEKAYEAVPEPQILVREYHTAVHQYPQEEFNYCRLGLAYLRTGDEIQVQAVLQDWQSTAWINFSFTWCYRMLQNP